MVGLNRLQRAVTPPKSNIAYSEGHKSKGILDDYKQTKVLYADEIDSSPVFVSGGLPFGEIWSEDNTDQTTLNSSGKVQILSFKNNGHSNNTTPDHTEDHITITKAGKYLVTASLAVVNVAAQAHEIDVGLFKNDGTSQFNNVHGHRNLSGGGGDKGSISISGIIDTNVNDTIELWANTDTAADRIVIFEDITLTLFQIGG